MPEGVTPYPRWQGSLAEGSRLFVVMEGEMRRALQSTWVRLAVLLGFAWGLASIIELYQLRQDGAEVHTIDGYLAMLDQLRWFALAVAATVGGPALLDDTRTGALDLYLARAVTPGSYLAGKSLAVVGLTLATVWIPTLIYYGASFIFYRDHPDNWAIALLAGLAYSGIWVLVVAGLALGLSSVARSSRGATLMLLGGFAGMDIVVSDLLSSLTGKSQLDILSPFAAMDQFKAWLFALDPPHEFPAWWGLIEIVALGIAGWAMLLWRRPTVKGAA